MRTTQVLNFVVTEDLIVDDFITLFLEALLS